LFQSCLLFDLAIDGLQRSQDFNLRVQFRIPRSDKKNAPSWVHF
jgi:hypothetical protein